MARRDQAIRIENLRELDRALRQAGSTDLRRELRQSNRRAADIVRDEARSNVPQRSGALARSIGSQAGRTDAKVKAGSAARVPYAGPIHFGWPARNIRPQPFLYQAMAEKSDEVKAAYEEAMDRLGRQVSTD